MFELLLQADKALADGSLEQAERTYWQLIDLDPKNAIAVAGLARVALERGDEKAARKFAYQALGIDPDSIAARRILDTLAHAGPKVVDDPITQQMLGAERLEALSHRRTADARADDESKAASSGLAARHAAGNDAAPETVPGSDMTAGSAAPAESGQGQESRGPTRPDQMEPMPAEPLRERRKAGRLAAAAAAAAAAAREPVRARHQPHPAMPIGRRFFEPGELKASPGDEFSEAEMAAAIEAVDAVDAVDDSALAATKPHRPAVVADRDLGRQADLLGAVEATDPDESVALRLALISTALELDAAERETQDFDEEANDSFEAAEAVASSSLHASTAAPRGTRPTYVVEPDRDFDEAEAEAEAAVFAQAAAESGAKAESGATAEAADAAEAAAAAAAEAMKEVSSADAAADPEPARVRRPFKLEVAEEPSEAEAEAQALREALSLVLDSDPPEGPEVDPGYEPATNAQVQPGEALADMPVATIASSKKSGAGGGEPAVPAESAEPAESADGGSETENGAAATTPDAADAATEPQPRRGGIFRRIRRG